MKKKIPFIFFAISIEIGIILVIAVACLIAGFGYYIFYHLIYGLLLSTLVPLLYVRKNNEPAMSLGIKPIRPRQVAVIIAFVVFSVGGRLIPLWIDGATIHWEYLCIGFFPMVMTTFFEEFLFRVFLQTRFEKMFGYIPAILISGFLFSIYHIGYPGFRTFSALILLFIVGVGFALAYKLSGNNLMVAYFVNLPNALVTYILQNDQFPAMDYSSVLASVIAIILIVLLMRKSVKKLGQNDGLNELESFQPQ